MPSVYHLSVSGSTGTEFTPVIDALVSGPDLLYAATPGTLLLSATTVFPTVTAAAGLVVGFTPPPPAPIFTGFDVTGAPASGTPEGVGYSNVVAEPTTATFGPAQLDIAQVYMPTAPVHVATVPVPWVTVELAGDPDLIVYPWSIEGTVTFDAAQPVPAWIVGAASAAAAAAIDI